MSGRFRWSAARDRRHARLTPNCPAGSRPRRACTRASANAVGLDRFWSNVRTHSLHDPVAYKQREVGDHFLNGTHPPFMLFT